MAGQERITQVFRRSFAATLAAVAAVLLIFTIYQLRLVALIVAISGLLAYLLAGPIEVLSKKLNRVVSVAIVFVIFLLLLAALLGSFVPILAQQIQELAAAVPDMVTRLEDWITGWRFTIVPGKEVHFSDYMVNMGDMFKERAPGILANAFDFTQSLVSGTAAVLAAILIIPLMTLYFLLDSAKLRRSVVLLFSEHMRSDVEKALTAVSYSLGSYIKSRVVLALFVGIATTVVLGVAGIPFALLLGLLAFVGEFIPVIGPWMAFIPAALVVLATDPYKFFLVGIFVILIQLIETYVIVPKLMGDTMDLHPLTVIVAMLVGGSLGGIAGLLVAIPAAAALKVIFNIFILRRKEPGIEVPQLQTISAEPEEEI